jgi:hypothetical protein
MYCLRSLGSRDRGSNPTWMFGVVMRLFCVCVVLCLGRGLATSWSPVQGVLPSVNEQETEKSALCSKGGTRGRKKIEANTHDSVTTHPYPDHNSLVACLLNKHMYTTELTYWENSAEAVPQWSQKMYAQSLQFRILVLLVTSFGAKPAISSFNFQVQTFN